MFDLFGIETENQTKALTTSLLALERDPRAADLLEACMRAAHSLKGAARIVGVDSAAQVAHVMEELFVAAQCGRLVLRPNQVDLMLGGVDLLTKIAASLDDKSEPPNPGLAYEVAAFQREVVLALVDGDEAPAHSPSPVPPPRPAPDPVPPAPEPDRDRLSPDTAPASERSAAERVVRVGADSLNRLLGLAGEQRVEAGNVRPFGGELLRLKRQLERLGRELETTNNIAAARGLLTQCQDRLTGFMTKLDLFDRRAADLARRLYDETIACRMRPFEDGASRLERGLRDLGHTLGKQVRLEIIGAKTDVDRDILEHIQAPLGHLLRNAVDHGIETPEERAKAGKPIEAVVRLEARHRAGLLQIIMTDDGRGIDLEQLRATVVARKLASPETARILSEAELVEFLFLPGFTTKDQVTEISGRGVGLDVVKAMVKQVHGSVRVSNTPGQGVAVLLQLPLTLSVISGLLAEIGGEAYAFPLAGIERAAMVPQSMIETLEGRQYFRLHGRPVGLVPAYLLLGGREPTPINGEIAVVVLGDSQAFYGLVVDRFIGQSELAIRALDPRLGKIQDISAASVLDDGSPALIVDIDDLLRSIEKLAQGERLTGLSRTTSGDKEARRKRVLVVDDSLTVRELERKMLVQHGYEVEVAVDGMDGWNAVRTGHFDLVVTDVDMPRLDGIELVRLIKADPKLRLSPVMIVSYKDREIDRQRGLDAGADYYLTKGSFHDENLIAAVADLIGEAGS